ncbi:F0F1 ATP synthase subunit delta [Microbulbifer sp.]|uniref:F0F1 ATP synthase subunit delta n=1 Tax=Microbulbifer sp. TaxID=1908541 RepID=UPI003F4062A4
MELSWSTFLLEIVNFLVLVWILKRFFYKPLQSVIARRRQDIEQRLAEAEKMREEAERLQREYEGRMNDWERERQRARTDLQQEMKAERAQLEQALQEALQQQRQKAEVIEQRRQREQRHQLQQRALEQGSHFAARLLEQAAGPELERNLQQLLLASLAELPEDRLVELRRQLPAAGEPLEVSSAFPLSANRREQIRNGLQQMLQNTVHCHFSEDSDLIAGLRLVIGPWVLGANVRDELRGFARIAWDTDRE